MTSTPLPEQGGDTPISDKEAWLRIFEVIRPAVNSTDYATDNTNSAFDAMKKKLENTKAQSNVELPEGSIHLPASDNPSPSGGLSGAVESNEQGGVELTTLIDNIFDSYESYFESTRSEFEGIGQKKSWDASAKKITEQKERLKALVKQHELEARAAIRAAIEQCNPMYSPEPNKVVMAQEMYMKACEQYEKNLKERLGL